MVDMDHAYVWAWDARPFPEFPGQTTVWSDGGNYSCGHWLNGRASNQPLSAVVRELCRKSGVEALDVNALFGLFAAINRPTSRLNQRYSLMLAFGFDVFEREDGGISQSHSKFADGSSDSRACPGWTDGSR
jgi:hypothetical protein